MDFILFTLTPDNIYYINVSVEKKKGLTMDWMDRQVISLQGLESGKRYSRLFSDLTQIIKDNPDRRFIYRDLNTTGRYPVKHETFAHSVILDYFCIENSIQICKLRKSSLTKQLSSEAKFKQEKDFVIDKYSLTLSHNMASDIAILSLSLDKILSRYAD